MQKSKKQYFRQYENQVYNSEIKYLEAQLNYTKVYFKNGIIKKSAYTIKRFEELLLDNKNFIRIHRSFIVNMNFVDEVNFETKKIILKNGPVLQISRRKMEKLTNYLLAI